MADTPSPANIIILPESRALQLVHYPGTVAGVTDFDQATNAAALGNFLNGAANDGDQTTFDYVDLRKSLSTGAAKELSFYVESAAGTELLIVIDPIAYINQYPTNTGYRKRVHRILCPAGLSATYTITGARVQGFNIDYNGTFTGAGTPGVDKLVITAS